MERDRLLNILRWVVTPIVLAIIAGYFQMRVTTIAGQTRASYDTLAPSVLELQDKVATLTGRIEELSKRPVAMLSCPEATKPASKPASRVEAPKPHTGLGALGMGKTEVMVDRPAPPEPAPSPKKIPARFDDMVQQQAK